MNKNIVERSVDVDDISISSTRRAIVETAVLQLAASMSEIGLQHPITVRWIKNLNDPDDGAIMLVAGRHRLEAARRSGRSQKSQPSRKPSRTYLSR